MTRAQHLTPIVSSENANVSEQYFVTAEIVSFLNPNIVFRKDEHFKILIDETKIHPNAAFQMLDEYFETLAIIGSYLPIPPQVENLFHLRKIEVDNSFQQDSQFCLYEYFGTAPLGLVKMISFNQVVPRLIVDFRRFDGFISGSETFLGMYSINQLEYPMCFWKWVTTTAIPILRDTDIPIIIDYLETAIAAFGDCTFSTIPFNFSQFKKISLSFELVVETTNGLTAISRSGKTLPPSMELTFSTKETFYGWKSSERPIELDTSLLSTSVENELHIRRINNSEPLITLRSADTTIFDLIDSLFMAGKYYSPEVARMIEMTGIYTLPKENPNCGYLEWLRNQTVEPAEYLQIIDHLNAALVS